MNKFKQYVDDSNLLEIAKKVWIDFPKMQIHEDIIVDIREFELSINGINKNRINVTKIDDSGRASFYSDKHLPVIDIKVGNASTLVHELSHTVYKYPKNQRLYFSGMANYIIGFLNENESIIEYLNRPAIMKYDTIIGYLCLADDDELTAKLAGFYVPHLLLEEELKESDYFKKLKQIYNDIKEFTCSPDEIVEIIGLDKENKLISPHLSANGLKNPLDSNAIQTLIKEINDQGAKFIRIYEGLLYNL